jgi:hypothetical protein
LQYPGPNRSLPIRPSRNENEKGGFEAAFFLGREAGITPGGSGPLPASLLFDRPLDQRNRGLDFDHG